MTVTEIPAAAVGATTPRAVAADRTFGQIMGPAVFLTTAFFFLATALACYMVSDDLVFGLAVGGFSAAWGGPGFGVMIGGFLWHVEQERKHAEAR